MTITTEAAAETAAGASEKPAILVRRPATGKAGIAETIARVAKEARVSPFRQSFEILKLKFSKAGISAKEYYAQQVYLQERGAAEKKSFVGEMGSYRLNLKLSPPGLTNMRGFFADKIAFGAVMRDLGMPTTRAQAAYAARRHLGALPTLRSAEELAAFLRQGVRYPAFGKPIDGLQAIGSVGLAGYDEVRDEVRLTSGKTVAAEDLARDIVASYPGGFVIEDAIVQHPAMTAVVGPAVATVRVVTVMAEEAPQVLYAIWKVPSPTAMSDNFWQAGSMIALPDPETGAVAKCRRGTGPDTEWIETHPASGLPLVGFRLPFWAEAKALAVATHAMFPINGVLGWDVAITPEGPLVIECNENPGHALYQLASGRGILSAAFTPVFDKVIARNAAYVKAFRARERTLARDV